MLLVIISSGIKYHTDNEWERKQKDLIGLRNKLISWDVVNRAPHQVWQVQDGRKVMEKILKQLVKVVKKTNLPE